MVIHQRAPRDPLRFDVKGRLAALLNIADGSAPPTTLDVGSIVPRDKVPLSGNFSVLNKGEGEYDPIES